MTQAGGQDRTFSAFQAALAGLASVIVLQPLFVAALVYVRIHTNLDAVKSNIAAAYEHGVLSIDEVPRLLLHRYGHQFTECVALQVALDNEEDVLKAALAPQLHSPFISPCRELQRFAVGVETGERTDYGRYWHGYRIYLWPMLEHVSLATMRFINAAILIAILVYFLRSFRVAIGPTPAAILFIVLMSLTDIWRIWRITPHFVPMVIILGGAGFFARTYARYRNPNLAVVLAAILGAVFNFFDFLANPPMLPMLLSFTIVAIESARRTYATRRQMVDALWLPGLIALSWFGGYLLTWSVKWCLSIWLQDNGGQTMLDTYRQIILRLYGQEIDNRVPIIPLLPTVKMILQSFIAVGSIPVAILAAAIFVHVRRYWGSFDRRRFVVLISPTVIPIVWFELLSNHTQTHSHFTYRSEAAAIALILAAAVISAPEQPPLGELFRHLKHTLRWPRRADAR